MTVNDLIKKHQLEQVPHTLKADTPTAIEPKHIPSTMQPKAASNDYIVYSNNDQSIWITLDRSRNLFKIMYAEIVILESDWLDASIDYVVEL